MTNRQTTGGQLIAAAGDLTPTYFGVYVNKAGVRKQDNFPSSKEARPFRLLAASVWVARPGGINPDGIKLIIALSTTDEGRNIDLLEAPQRAHYHLTWYGDIVIDYAVILECVTQGLVAGDILNYMLLTEGL